MDVLASTLGAGAYLTTVTVLKPIPAVLHIPRTGEGAFYLGQARSRSIAFRSRASRGTATTSNSAWTRALDRTQRLRST
jgi:hypothetical protein